MIPVPFNGVYFYLADAPFKSREHHSAGCLMDGLIELGFPVYSNTPYPGATVRSLGEIGAFLYVFTLNEDNFTPEFTAAAAAFAAPHKCLLSMSDLTCNWPTPPSIPALYTHLSKFRRSSSWQIPWAIGYSTRAAMATAMVPAWETRTPSLLANFRPTPNQHVRNAVDVGHGPWLATHFAFDRSISGQHFERLLAYQACNAVGGMFFEDLTLNGFFGNQQSHRDLARKTQFFRDTVVVRWDSWRFYESLAAGCLTLQLDLGKYGLPLPVMPVPWKHYIPLTFDDPKGDIQRMIDLRPEWPVIAAAGRAWVQANYSPRACAQRLLDYAANQFKVPGWGPFTTAPRPDLDALE